MNLYHNTISRQICRSKTIFAAVRREKSTIFEITLQFYTIHEKVRKYTMRICCLVIQKMCPAYLLFSVADKIIVLTHMQYCTVCNNRHISQIDSVSRRTVDLFIKILFIEHNALNIISIQYMGRICRPVIESAWRPMLAYCIENW